MKVFDKFAEDLTLAEARVKQLTRLLTDERNALNLCRAFQGTELAPMGVSFTVEAASLLLGDAIEKLGGKPVEHGPNPILNHRVV